MTEVLQLVDDLFAALDKPDFTAGAEALERLDEWRQRQREPQNGPELAEAAA